MNLQQLQCKLSPGRQHRYQRHLRKLLRTATHTLCKDYLQRVKFGFNHTTGICYFLPTNHKQNQQAEPIFEFYTAQIPNPKLYMKEKNASIKLKIYDLM